MLGMADDLARRVNRLRVYRATLKGACCRQECFAQKESRQC